LAVNQPLEDTNQTCSDIRADLPLSVGGDLDATHLERVEGHLETCEGCRREADRLSASRRVFQELGAGVGSSSADPTPDLWPAVRAGLRADGLVGPGHDANAEKRVAEGHAASGPPLPFRRLAAAAAVLVGLVTSALLWNGDESPGGIAPGPDGAFEMALPEAPATGPARGLRLVEIGERGLLEDAVPLGDGLDLYSLRALAGQRRILPLAGEWPSDAERESGPPLLEEPRADALQVIPHTGGIQFRRVRVR
jgi:hypothetical protein